MIPSGLLICFIGVDGSGKTTQVNLLARWLESQNIQAKVIWSRGKMLAVRRILLFMGRKALGTSESKIASDQKSYQEYQTRKSIFLNNPLVRTFWSFLVYGEHLYQINRDIRGKLRQGCVVICDRYLWDSTIDLAILNHKNPQWLSGRLNRLAWKLVPHPAVAFFIDIPPETAMQRKDDIPSLDYIAARVQLYHYAAKYSKLTMIDGCQEVGMIHAQIIDRIKKTLEGKE